MGDSGPAVSELDAAPGSAPLARAKRRGRFSTSGPPAVLAAVLLAIWGTDVVVGPWALLPLVMGIASACVMAWTWWRERAAAGVPAAVSDDVIESIAANGARDWQSLDRGYPPATRLTIRRASGKETLEFPTNEALNDAIAKIDLPENRRVFLGTDFRVVELAADAIRVFELSPTLGISARYAFSEITTCAAKDDWLLLHMNDGTSVEIRIEGFVPLVLDRVERAIASRVDLPAADALARGDRDALSWTRELRVSANAVTYRNTNLDPEALWNLVEAPGATPAQRASAAVALSSQSLSDDDRDRLRAIAAATSSKPVASTFIRVADGASEQALAEALEALDAEGSERTSAK